MDQLYLTIISSILGISGALLGTLFGYFLNKCSSRKEKEHQIESTRMLIGLKIEKILK